MFIIYGVELIVWLIWHSMEPLLDGRVARSASGYGFHIKLVRRGWLMANSMSWVVERIHQTEGCDLLTFAGFIKASTEWPLSDISLVQDLEDFLQDGDNVRVTIPELELLRQYHADAHSWICHLKDVLPNLNERKDYHNVVGELNCILEAGKSLRVQGKSSFIFIYLLLEHINF